MRRVRLCDRVRRNTTSARVPVPVRPEPDLLIRNHIVAEFGVDYYFRWDSDVFRQSEQGNAPSQW